MWIVVMFESNGEIRTVYGPFATEQVATDYGLYAYAGSTFEVRLVQPPK